jgi:hypothetical protein
MLFFRFSCNITANKPRLGRRFGWHLFDAVPKCVQGEDGKSPESAFTSSSHASRQLRSSELIIFC